jgi:hypothetical protein
MVPVPASGLFLMDDGVVVEMESAPAPTRDATRPRRDPSPDRSSAVQCTGSGPPAGHFCTYTRTARDRPAACARVCMNVHGTPIKVTQSASIIGR